MFYEPGQINCNQHSIWFTRIRPICALALVAILAGMFKGETVFAQQEQKTSKIEQLAWLAGSWSSVNESGYTTEEHWIAPKGGMMLAVNRTSKKGKAQFEFLRIQQKSGSLSLFASPGGRPPVEFKLAEIKENQVVFENPEHDFPQKITYRRETTFLHVRIEAVDNGQTRKIEWTWKRNS